MRGGFGQADASTARTVDGYHFAPPCAVGTRSRLSSSAIAASDLPAFRRALIRDFTFVGSSGGRPSRTPWAFLCSSASRVRWPISLRSNCANVPAAGWGRAYSSHSRFTTPSSAVGPGAEVRAPIQRVSPRGTMRTVKGVNERRRGTLAPVLLRPFMGACGVRKPDRPYSPRSDLLPRRCRPLS